MTEAISGVTNRQKPRKRWPWLAALMSFLLPGLGQLYIGQWMLALPLMLVGQGLYPLLALLIVLDGLTVWNFALCMFGGMAIQLGAAIHAFVLARRTPLAPPQWWTRWYGLVGGVTLYFAIGIATASLYDDPIKSFHIPANSMQPNVPAGDRLIAVALYGKPVERGEIVVFEREAERSDFIKRVVAVAGDSIEMRDNRLWVNDRQVSREVSGSVVLGSMRLDIVEEVSGDRSYNVLTMGSGGSRVANFPRRIVPAGHVFVLGDNRDNSMDSRFFGPVKIADVHWRAAFVFWSRDWDRIGIDLRTKP